jgi:hypothetical protein
LVIVSNQGNKFFPHDFFGESKECEGSMTSRGDNSLPHSAGKKIIKKDLARINIQTEPKFIDSETQKRLLDFDKEIEEDKELLDLLSDKSKII